MKVKKYHYYVWPILLKRFGAQHCMIILSTISAEKTMPLFGARLSWWRMCTRIRAFFFLLFLVMRNRRNNVRKKIFETVWAVHDFYARPVWRRHFKCIVQCYCKKLFLIAFEVVYHYDLQGFFRDWSYCLSNCFVL